MADFCEIWNPSIQRNKYIFINRNKEHALPKPSTVLINPHFKENKMVFLNPRFPRATNDINTQPKVYVNPNILKSVMPESRIVAITPAFQQESDSGLRPSHETHNLPKSNYGHNGEMFEPHAIKNKVLDHRKSSFCKVNSNENRSKIVHTKTKIINGPKSVEATPKPLHVTSSTPYANGSSNNIRQGENQRTLHTRLKIINAPERTKPNPFAIQKKNIDVKDNSICTRFKYIRNVESHRKLPSISAESQDLQKANKILTNSSQASEISKAVLRNSGTSSSPEHTKNSVMTRFKYIRNGTKLIKIHKTPMKSKYKIVNNPSVVNKQEKKDRVRVNSSTYRKKYVFLNKYNSSSFLANNVILKNTKQRHSLKINGILYKNSPSLLKKQSSPKKKLAVGSQKVANKQEISCKGKYRIVRSHVTPAAKLKKCNLTCPIYRRTGKCKGLTNGTCEKVHNPDLIILCRSFLRGECHNDNCLLSHKVSPEKMPTCKYFLEGLCNKVECPYLHVKISPNAEICKDFLDGFCKEGIKCDKRHQFLCPEYERTQKCTKPKCIYPHRQAKTIKPKSIKRNCKKTPQKKANKPLTKKVEDEVNQIRYYKENVEDTNKSTKDIEGLGISKDEEMTIPKRKKLGLLPAFIPIS